MTAEFDLTRQQIDKAKCPEDIFGELKNNPFAALKVIYRKLSRIVHPDLNGDIPDAVAAFQALNAWFCKAERKVLDGSYGDRTADVAEVTITSKMGTIAVKHPIARGDLCDVFIGELAGQEVLVKMSRSPTVNSLVANEAAKLKKIRDELIVRNAGTIAHFPQLLGSFVTQDGSTQLRTNVFKYVPGFFAMTEVAEQYPNGLEPRDLAWMMNRAFAVVGTAHDVGVVHGAITSKHFVIRPEDHNGMLIDWSYSIGEGETLVNLAPHATSIYPPEVFDKKVDAPAIGVDIYMLGMLGLKLLHKSDDDHAAYLRRFFKSMIIPSWKARPDHVWKLYDEFTELLFKLYGRRKFKPFVMNANVDKGAA